MAGGPSYPVTLSRPDLAVPRVKGARTPPATPPAKAPATAPTSATEPAPAADSAGTAPVHAAQQSLDATGSGTKRADTTGNVPLGTEKGAETGRDGKAKGKRKVNTSAKGTGIELAAIKVLEAEGYKVHRCVRTGVKRGPFYFSQSNDVFGCIDLVAKKRGTRTRWIQVTAHSGIGQKKKDLDEVPWDPVHDSVEIWRWVGGQNRKHKSTGAFLERQYFQVYHLDHAYALRKDDRVLLHPPAPTPGGTAT